VNTFTYDSPIHAHCAKLTQSLYSEQYKLPIFVYPPFVSLLRHTYFFLTLALCFVGWESVGQQQDTLVVDSLVIQPHSMEVKWDSLVVSPQDYRLLPYRGSVALLTPLDIRRLHFNYATLPFKTSYFLYQRPHVTPVKPQAKSTLNPSSSAIIPGGIQANGVISRGIQVGNAQNLSVQSSMNLQLSGQVAEGWIIRGTLNDANIPFQPGGSTSRLEDFDQVYVELSGPSAKITAGDFTIKNQEGQFLKYYKRGQGLWIQHQKEGVTYSVSSSMSKGRFVRQTIQGQEGSQGPYKLEGGQGEGYIVVLAGTERVFIDGVLMQRGQDKDYVVDYNSGFITFTAARPITKDRRIVVEFQYSDKQYFRPLVTANWEKKWTGGRVYVQAFQEWDAKHQPLQAASNDSIEHLLAQVEDPGMGVWWDQAEWIEESSAGVLYDQIDSLGIAGIWRYTSKTSQAYRVQFSYVGVGQGDYVEEGFVAGGKKYKWVSPVWDGTAWQHQGLFVAKAKITPPTKQNMWVMGQEWNPELQNLVFKARQEIAWSEYDRNTFSTLDNAGNKGWAAKQEFTLSPMNKSYSVGWNWEYNSRYFTRVERFREVEFERNWNTLNLVTAGDFSNMGMEFNHRDSKSTLKWEKLTWGEFSGTRMRWKTQPSLVDDHVLLKLDGWALNTTGSRESSFVRNKSLLSWQGDQYKMYYQDEMEHNRYTPTGGVRSYSFYESIVGVGSRDTLQKKWVLYYRNRLDKLPDSTGLHLASATRAEQWGIDLGMAPGKQWRIGIQASQRNLRILDRERFNGTPERTFLGRVNLNWRDPRNVWTVSAYYEAGSGLEQKKSFVYLEVPAGQGQYVWNDYNGNGVKELNEFETAVFSYEANYIRVQAPTSSFIQVASGKMNIQVSTQPKADRLKRFSQQFSWQDDCKYTGGVRYDYWNMGIGDTALMQSQRSLRESIWFNSLNTNTSGGVVYLQNQMKTLLTNGYESKNERSLQVQWRWAMGTKWQWTPWVKQTEKQVQSDYLETRNYAIQSQTLSSPWVFRDGGKWTLSLIPEQVYKQENQTGSTLDWFKFSGKVQHNLSGSSMWYLETAGHRLRSTGEVSGTLAYDMWEGLLPGINYTWVMGIQRAIGMWQWSLNYSGRKSPDRSVIHAGSVGIKAVF
jgi:hypothetical protein